ncbi:MAG: hypothetical protein LUD17_01700 [Bacteroidales bacterium]|nr:hypothetical protein [Bacteroidales bacterium]
MSSTLTIYLKPKGVEETKAHPESLMWISRCEDMYSLFEEEGDIVWNFSSDEDYESGKVKYSDRYTDIDKYLLDKIFDELKDRIDNTNQRIAHNYKRIALTHSTTAKTEFGDEYDLLDDIDHAQEYLEELKHTETQIGMLSRIMDHMKYSDVYEGLCANFS